MTGSWLMKEQHGEQKFKVGDRVRFKDKLEGSGRTPGDLITQEKLAGKTGVLLEKRDMQEWIIEVDGKRVSYCEFRFELWDPITKVARKLAGKPMVNSSDPQGQRTTPIVHCVICNKEYSGPGQVNDVGDIIGGGVMDGPVKADGRQNEEMVMGPCCYARVMDKVMDLKTKAPAITTERKMQTNSWMPHDIDGDL